MKRLEATFERLRGRGEKGLIPFFTGGYPDLEATDALLRGAAGAGADIVEIGLPFSDSLADGPVIQGSYHAAIEKGVSAGAILDVIGGVPVEERPPVVVMTCTNLVLQPGLEVFADRLVEAGVSGTIVADLPLEECRPIEAVLAERGLANIRLLAPSTPPRRVRAIAEGARGFLYYISRRGITGARADVARDLSERVARIKACTDRPVAVGFGIATPEQAAEVGAVADAAVVGSALVQLLGETGSTAAVLEAMGALKDALRPPR